MTTSGLSLAHCKRATNLALQAAVLGYHHAPLIHYTQGPVRWEGLDRRLRADRGQFPRQADCSSFLTWCLAQGLLYVYGLGDIVNGEHWQAGYTGTLLNHGRRVSRPFPGCAVIYGGGTGEHTALYTGGGKVVSHGSEGGPYLLPWNYRSDLNCFRSYIY